MNAPATITADGFFVPIPVELKVREEWTVAERAHRASISLHLPNEGEAKMACRVAIAILRDRASAGIRRCSDASYGVLTEIERQATHAVFSPRDARGLYLIRAALTSMIDCASMLESANKPARKPSHGAE